MSDLPAPFTAADCDLRTMPSLPLDVVRLLDSDLFLFGSGDEFKAAVALWLKSWQQVPAASLPDEDRILAVLSGAGGKWKRVRERALRGWVKCSDGRLYHPVVADKAKIAWAQRQAQRDRANRRWNGTKGSEPPPKGDLLNDAGAYAAAYPTAHAAALPAHMQVNGNGKCKKEEVIQAASFGSARDARPPRSGPMPTLNDPPDRWFHLADRTEDHHVDGVIRPVVGGWFLDITAFEVCRLSGINGHSRPVDWTPLIGWLRDGLDPETTIYPAIRCLASRPGYTPPRFLTYFDGAIREGKAA